MSYFVSSSLVNLFTLALVSQRLCWAFYASHFGFVHTQCLPTISLSKDTFSGGSSSNGTQLCNCIDFITCLGTELTSCHQTNALFIMKQTFQTLPSVAQTNSPLWCFQSDFETVHFSRTVVLNLWVGVWTVLSQSYTDAYITIYDSSKITVMK